MQLNRVLKRLMSVALVIVTVACNSNKNTNYDNKSTIGDNTGTGIDVNQNNGYLNEQDRLHIQDLQRDNIVYFDLNKYNIHLEFMQLIDAHANFLRSHPYYKVTIEGHADERGTPEYNIALGERRANAVKMYLQSKGVAADQIAILSYGKEKPAVLGYDESAYAKNRRAVIVLLY